MVRRRRVISLITVLGLVSVLAVVVLSAATTAVADGADAPAWVWPLDPPPEVIRDFDPPDTPWGSGHRGVDLAAEVDQSVHAAGAGTVTYAGTLAGRGVVTVTHGTTRTTYEPVSSRVEVGHEVEAGDVLGAIEARGQHCAPRHCLHWGLLRGTEYLDPLMLLADGPVRLLPLDDLPTPDTDSEGSQPAGDTGSHDLGSDAGTLADPGKQARRADSSPFPGEVLTRGLVAGTLMMLIVGMLLGRRL